MVLPGDAATSRRWAPTRTPTDACSWAARSSTPPGRGAPRLGDPLRRHDAHGLPAALRRHRSRSSSSSPSSPRATRGCATGTSDGAGKLWPCPDPEHSEGAVVLFGDGFPTASGPRDVLARRGDPASRSCPSEEYPFVLNTGRTLAALAHRHDDAARQGARRDRAGGLLRDAPRGPAARSASRTASLRPAREPARRHRRCPCAARRDVSRGSVFVPFHFREAAANLLTSDELDPDGKIPGFKFSACAWRRSDPRLPGSSSWHLLAVLAPVARRVPRDDEPVERYPAVVPPRGEGGHPGRDGPPPRAAGARRATGATRTTHTPWGTRPCPCSRCSRAARARTPSRSSARSRGCARASRPRPTASGCYLMAIHAKYAPQAGTLDTDVGSEDPGGPAPRRSTRDSSRRTAPHSRRGSTSSCARRR